jgi:hypothetical protein
MKTHKKRENIYRAYMFQIDAQEKIQKSASLFRSLQKEPLLLLPFHHL